jgi:hypothetical protein
LILAVAFAILAATSRNECRCTDVIIQPEKRWLIAWTVLTALAVAMVITVNLMVQVRAI